MRITQLDSYRNRNPNGYFHDLPLDIRISATQWLDHFCKRWDGNLPRWRFAILVGQAKRLALNPPTSAWGRSMRAKKGGYATQWRYIMEGRTGQNHPAHHAAIVSASNRKRRKQQREDNEQCKRMGLLPQTRVRYLSLN